MGCCGAVDKNIDDLPLGKLEEFNILKSEINEIISDKDNKDRKNANKIFELFHQTSNKITEYEREVKKLKNKKLKDKNINDDIIEGLNNDIKQLREYNHTLNDLLKETDENANNNKTENQLIFEIKNETENDFENEKEIINEEINVSNGKENDNNEVNVKNRNNNNNLEDILENDYQNGFRKGDFKNESENDFNFNNNNEIVQTLNELENDLNNNSNDPNNIYFKKYIRRNKKSEVLNKKSKSYPKADPFGFPNEEKTTNFNYNENEELIENNEIKNDENKNDENNVNNIIFALENGEKINVQIDKNGKLLDALEKFGEMMEDYNDIGKLEIYDGNDDITDKVKNGEVLSAFDFNDYHIIQIKLKD